MYQDHPAIIKTRQTKFPILNYDDADLMPEIHRLICDWAYRGRTSQQIAEMLKLDIAKVRKVLAFPPCAQYVESLRERKRMLVEMANEKKVDVAVQAFDYMAGVVSGKEKPQRDRVDAAKHMMSMDPIGRYEKYNGKSDSSSSVLDTSNLEDYIEHKRKIIPSNDVTVEDAE